MRAIHGMVGFLILLGACARAVSPSRPVARGATAGSTSASVTASASVAPALPPVAACTAIAELAFPPPNPYDGTAELENVRVANAPGASVVTEEVEHVPLHGDSSHHGTAAWIDWTANPPGVKRVTLPARAYASAASTTLGPTWAGTTPELVVFGDAGIPTFELYDAPAAKWPREPYIGDPPRSLRSIAPRFAPGKAIAVASTAPIVAAQGWEAPCASYYTCTEFANQYAKGFLPSLRTFSLTSPTKTELLWQGTKRDQPSQLSGNLVPAIAFGATRGAVAARLDGAITLFWLDATYHASAGIELARGEVGAPAVGFSGDTAIVAWARRDSNDLPYHLEVWTAPSGATNGTVRVVKTVGSAFAPSIAGFGDHALVAWMEGDGASRGLVRVAPAPLTGELDWTKVPSLTGESGNARDPELATAGAEVTLVWSEFTKAAPGGRTQVRRLACAP